MNQQKENNEIWLPVNNYEGKYIVSNNGIIKSLHQRSYNKILIQRIDRAGYFTVRLSKHGTDYTKYVHRILAEAFVLNPENKPIVNHKDGNKLNNAIENLEWVLQSENVKHAYKLGFIHGGKRNAKVIDICTGQEFESIKEAAKVLSINYNTCRNMLNGFNKNNTCLKKVV
jgi:hypothetical protein